MNGFTLVSAVVVGGMVVPEVLERGSTSVPLFDGLDYRSDSLVTVGPAETVRVGVIVPHVWRDAKQDRGAALLCFQLALILLCATADIGVPKVAATTTAAMVRTIQRERITGRTPTDQRIRRGT